MTYKVTELTFLKVCFRVLPKLLGNLHTVQVVPPVQKLLFDVGQLQSETELSVLLVVDGLNYHLIMAGLDSQNDITCHRGVSFVEV